MGKVYTVVFNCATGANNANLSDQTFFCDWSSHLEQGKYRGTFSFVSTNNTHSLTFHPMVFIDLGQSNYTSFAKAPGQINNNWSQDYIGSLETNSLGTNQMYYFATTETNPPFYLEQRPNNNIVKVFIYNQRGFQNTLFGNVIGNWTLTLQFEKID